MKPLDAISFSWHAAAAFGLPEWHGLLSLQKCCESSTCREICDALVQDRVGLSLGICWSGGRRTRLHRAWSSKSGDQVCELRFCNSEGLPSRVCDSPEQKPRFVFPQTHVPVFTQ